MSLLSLTSELSYGEHIQRRSFDPNYNERERVIILTN